MAGSTTGAKVSWMVVCRPKSEGGLGLKRAAEWNMACLARLIWLFFASSGSLWVAWVKDVILKEKNFWNIQVDSNSSWC